MRKILIPLLLLLSIASSQPPLGNSKVRFASGYVKGALIGKGLQAAWDFTTLGAGTFTLSDISPGGTSTLCLGSATAPCATSGAIPTWNSRTGLDFTPTQYTIPLGTTPSPRTTKTFEIVFNVPPGGADQLIWYSQDGSTADRFTLGQTTTGNGSLLHACATTSAANCKQSSVAPAAGWHHVVVTKTTGAITKIYIDNLDVTAAEAGPVWNAANPKHSFGVDWTNGSPAFYPITGSIAFAAEYNRVLTAAEIQHNHCALRTLLIVPNRDIYFPPNGCPSNIVLPWVTRANQYKAVLHTHSGQVAGHSPACTGDTGGSFDALTNSYCPSTLLTQYQAIGIDIVGLTDHDVITTVGTVPSGMVLLSGIESSADPFNNLPGHNGKHHMGVYPTASLPGTAVNQAVIDFANTNSAISVLQHPLCNGLTYTAADIKALRDFTLLEVWNALTFCSDSGASQNSETLWDVALTYNRKAWGTAGEDFHDTDNHVLGAAWNVVNVDTLTQENVTTALRAGNFYATQGPTLTLSLSGSTLTATSASSGVFHWTKQNGTTAKTDASAGTSDTYTFNGTEQYVRVTFTRTSDSLKAWAQPVFVNPL